jgi:hypothetical protein
VQKGVDESVKAAQKVAAVAPGLHPVAAVLLLKGGHRIALHRRELQAVAANPVGEDSVCSQPGSVAAGLQAETKSDVRLNVAARAGGDEREVCHSP